MRQHAPTDAWASGLGYPARVSAAFAAALSLTSCWFAGLRCVDDGSRLALWTRDPAGASRAVRFLFVTLGDLQAPMHVDQSFHYAQPFPPAPAVVLVMCWSCRSMCLVRFQCHGSAARRFTSSRHPAAAALPDPASPAPTRASDSLWKCDSLRATFDPVPHALCG